MRLNEQVQVTLDADSYESALRRMGEVQEELGLPENVRRYVRTTNPLVHDADRFVAVFYPNTDAL
jgi:hypothetical protein